MAGGSKMVLRGVFAAGAAALLAAGVLAPTAGAGVAPTLAAPLTVLTVVDGIAPAGTTFTATIHCDGAIIDEGGSGTDTATVTFDATGQPTSADTVGFGGPGVCTVTETASGGASSVAYGCTGQQGTISGGVSGFEHQASASDVLPPVCATTGPVDPIEVNISAEDQSATVTVTNTFVAPTPSPAVVVQPAFTG